ncbi:MAG: glutamine--fructose-6-phosphate transaminase (isomerizing) [Synergistetes bacterium]|nr:glutamine--fructose-6-phosphate transaminase (isomerizing) [Synergistota bacterium]MDW8192725.1 glutamine--fructose-6-phosphate transaminase (isomerizing) [Synergistota bacterium]
MCGIIGYIGYRNVIPILIEGLYRLEYRGYDSAGVALLSDGRIKVVKTAGKIRDLENLIKGEDLLGSIGIGHTRWATHGSPNDVNAHPHVDVTGRFALVHNGIIENYKEIKHELQLEGIRFSSETDTEVIVQLISKYYSNNLEEAVAKALKRLDGSYAIAVISTEEPRKLVAARYGSPLVLGIGEGETFLASDVPAILPYTRKVVYLEDREVVVVEESRWWVFDLGGARKVKQVHFVEWDSSMVSRGGYKHYMLKEINEQGSVVRNVLKGRLKESSIDLSELDLDDSYIKSLNKIFIVACGTSYHAGMVGKCIFERWARIPVEVDIGSEFRYRDPIIPPGSLTIAISQSGETADTLAGLREAKAKGSFTLALANVQGSTITREAHRTMYLRAGPEIGVASTKAFTAQLSALYLLAFRFAQVRGTLSERESEVIIRELWQLPYHVEACLALSPQVKELSQKYYHYSNFLYLARGINYPIALEGALKLKEISYIHAEAYAAGEMKHGPIALIDELMPVLVIVPKDKLYAKTLSNIQEAKARHAKLIAIATEGDENMKSHVSDVLYVPEVLEEFYPLINVIPLQLFAYYVADILGREIDQPRNLAKSVTVE